MTKRELVIEVAERLGYTQNEVAAIVQAALDEIIDSLGEGERLEIRNFGVFEVKERDARIGRNPRTGEEVPIQKKRVATFKPGKALKELVQEGLPPEEPRTVPSEEMGMPPPQEAPPREDVPPPAPGEPEPAPEQRPLF